MSSNKIFNRLSLTPIMTQLLLIVIILAFGAALHVSEQDKDFFGSVEMAVAILFVSLSTMLLLLLSCAYRTWR